MSKSPTSARQHAAQALRTVLDAVKARNAPAELILAYFPRLFLQKERPVKQQINDFIMAELRPHERHDQRRNNQESAWIARVEQATKDGSTRRLLTLLDAGPHAGADRLSAEEAIHWIDTLHPECKAQHAEHDAWRAGTAQIAAQADTPVVSPRMLRRWAHAHKESSGGSAGWAPRLIMEFDAIDSQLIKDLAALWSRPPDQWLDPLLANTQFRGCDGWLIPQPTKGKPRPIAAPQVVRRVRTAADSARCHRAVAEYCEPRRQIGCSGEGYTLAYSLVPNIFLAVGGTTVSADRSDSFQTFTREALLTAASTFTEWCSNNGRQAEAAAFIRMVNDTFVCSQDLDATRVTFLEKTVRVAALAQGCSLSPLLEAVTLVQSNPLPCPNLIITAAHDDLQTSFIGTPAPSDLALPDLSHIGGSYNAAKAVAVGAEAERLVLSGRASRSDRSSTVWGRPVGDLSHWLQTHWLPKYNERIDKLVRIASIDPDIAAVAAHKLRGPGGLAQHWLRGTPPRSLTQDVLLTLREADDRWIDLWVIIAGHSPNADDVVARRSAVRGAVFGKASGCLGHMSIQCRALATAAQGMLVAANVVQRDMIAAGIPFLKWAPLLLPTGSQVPTDYPTLVTALANIAERTQKDYEESRLQVARARLIQATLPEGRNLLVEALEPTSDIHRLHVSHQLTRGRSILRYTAARILGLPVWKAITPIGFDFSPPHACGHCGAPTILAPPVGDIVAADGPRALLDHQLEHAGACLKIPVAGSNLHRHNKVARTAAAIASTCGFDAAYHDGPLFDKGQILGRGPAQRPADWLVKDGDLRNHPGGVCHDVTIAAGAISKLTAAAKLKRAKYARQLAAHNHRYGFAVVAIGTSGVVTNETTDVVNKWATKLTSNRVNQDTPPGDPFREVWGALGRAFASAMAEQAYAWIDGHLRPRFHRRHVRFQPPSLHDEMPTDSRLSILRRSSTPSASTGRVGHPSRSQDAIAGPAAGNESPASHNEIALIRAVPPP